MFCLFCSVFILTEVVTFFNIIRSTSTTATVAILEIRDAVSYLITSTSSGGTQNVTQIFIEDIVFENGACEHTVTGFEPNTEYNLDLSYQDRAGLTFPLSSIEVTTGKFSTV